MSTLQSFPKELGTFTAKAQQAPRLASRFNRAHQRADDIQSLVHILTVNMFLQSALAHSCGRVPLV